MSIFDTSIQTKTRKVMKTVKIKDLKVGDKFKSKGSVLTLARVKGETEKTMNLFCLHHIMSSYSSGHFNKEEEVILL